MTATADAGSGTASAARRAERLAAAEALLTRPPPLQALRPRHVAVVDRCVVHPSRSRPVVRWSLEVDRGSGTSALAVIGKGYLRGGGDEAWRLLGRLWRAGREHPGLHVPQPYGFDPSRRLLAQEEAPRTTLRALLDEVPAAHAATAGRVGHWLAGLHRVRGVELPVLPDDFERGKLTEYGDALAELLPGAAGRVAALTAGTLDALASVGSGRVVTHGDFQPGNIHLDRDRVVVIDFDRAAYAPAARDIGHFVGQTLTMGASRHGELRATAPWVDAFLDGYAAAGGDPAAVAAAPAYVARTFAEVLFYRLVVRPMPDRSFVPTWLDAWEHSLEAAVVPW